MSDINGEFGAGKKGFHYTFENGVTVSVQFGSGNYCDNYTKDLKSVIVTEYVKCNNAEVAVWDKDGAWITSEYEDNGDEVLPSKTPKKVLDILYWAEQHK